ncbi:MAG: ribbon-helix-helix protein, CopG family [Comamonadaceae bacterium]|nr:MAG: ribbon-helix-helix protein, CopG family [Comamonadaceae bacterium]
MTKPARLTVLMDADKKAQFDALCGALGRNSSDVVRALIRGYLGQRGIQVQDEEFAPPPIRRGVRAPR